MGPKKRKSLILWRARQESNLYQELRKLSFYPLNYGHSAAAIVPDFSDRPAGPCAVRSWRIGLCRYNRPLEEEVEGGHCSPG